MKTKILVAALAAGFAIAPAANAAGTDPALSISGQVSNAIGFGSDFEESFNVVQSDNSGSRFRFKLQKEWGGIKVGLRHEIQNRKGADSATAQDDLRYSDIYFSGSFGKLAFGQGDGAANGVTESYSDTTGNYFGGIDGYDFTVTAIDNFDAPEGSTDATINDPDFGFTNFDFLSRNQRLRYDSPKFAGLQFSASQRSQDGTELALRYVTKFGGWKLRSQAGYSTTDAADTSSIVAGIQTPVGVNFSFRVTEVEFDDGRPDGKSDLVAIGYRAGKFRISAEFAEVTTATGRDVDGTLVGLTYAGPVLLFAQIGEFEDVASGRTFSAPVIGARLKF